MENICIYGAIFYEIFPRESFRPQNNQIMTITIWDNIFIRESYEIYLSSDGAIKKALYLYLPYMQKKKKSWK